MLLSMVGRGGEEDHSELVLLDTAGTGVWQSLLRLAESVRPCSTGSSLVLVNSGWGGSSWNERNRANLLSPRHVLSEDAVHELYLRVERSAELITGRQTGLFPIIGGLDVGLLNKLKVQYYLEEVFTPLHAAFLLVDKRTIRSVRPVTADPFLVHLFHNELSVPVDLGGIPSVLQTGRKIAEAIRRVPWIFTQGDSALPEPSVDSCFLPVDSGRSRALFVSESVPMDQMFFEVERACLRRGLACPVRLQYENADPEASTEEGVVRRHLGQPGSPGGRITRPLKDAWQRAYQVLTESPDSLLAPSFAPFLSSAYRRVLPRQLQHATQVDHLINLVDPSVIIVGNDHHWVGQTFVQLARKRSIPTLAIQDGIAYDAPPWWWSTADVTATSGEFLRRLLIDHGTDPARCVVTGQPRYDKLVHAQGYEREQRVRRQLGIAEEGFHVLFATQYGQSTGYMQQVVNAALSVSGVHLLLRPHPSQSPRWHRRAVQTNERMSLHEKEDIGDLLLACDVLVAHNSTVIVEASILRKPVVIANFGDLPTRLPYEELGLGIVTRSPSHLREELDRQIRQPTREVVAAESADHLGPLDGSAADRVADLIEMLSSRRG